MKTKLGRYDDTLTMAGRCLLLSKRNPDTFFASILLPAVMMILFVSLFGGLISVENMSYVNYIVPGILIQCIAQGSSVTAIMMNKDITGGMASRYSTLPIKKICVLNGHIAEAVVRSIVTSAVVLIIALLLGFRPSLDYTGTAVFVLILFCTVLMLSWLAVALGLAAGSAEGASALAALAVILPYLSSGFVPTDALPDIMKIFAEYQPMTPIIDTMRSALLGKPLDIKVSAAAFIWCIALSIIMYFISAVLFRRRLSRQ